MFDFKFAASVFFSRKVAKRSAMVAIIVGTILAFINHGDLIFTGTPEGVSGVQPGDVMVATIQSIGGMQVAVTTGR